MSKPKETFLLSYLLHKYQMSVYVENLLFSTSMNRFSIIVRYQMSVLLEITGTWYLKVICVENAISRVCDATKTG